MQLKNRPLSLVFWTNSDGTDKITMTEIGKSANTRSFKKFNPALYEGYENIIRKLVWLKHYFEGC